MPAQGFIDFDVLAVDDRSPDGSGEILAKYAARDPRAITVRHEENRGIRAARNTGVERASGDQPQLDLGKITGELGPDTVLLVPTHYFYGQDPQLQKLQRQGALIDVSLHPSVEELCLAADALITDYSSIMFDYADLDRPIINYADDRETYVRSRGVTFDLLSGTPGDLPGIVATNEDELVEAFPGGRWKGAEARELRAAFRARFCMWDDGHAAERVVGRVFLGHQDLAPALLSLSGRTVAPAPHERPAPPRVLSSRSDGRRPPWCHEKDRIRCGMPRWHGGCR
ncbi:bifunctional glycosyltransferase family 2 protein/CDP-glycerol:glycerophosphate glycerophosphotransferase [Streptomyces sp. MCA2]|uniref:bifunctional glycosyltransferase/CDP-glycerol:glycerophosphate glycerophosphotransferase n=1 Tax=Streptomyces sp. MCA2 TaxID=2944805 RepID=UPI0020206DD8|nr:bifunctional glycosyltransferase family 2 protein/CDP-glycerol:glycerophosphate glycerophosphotransferase [Streptomyces sp. MCA2]